VINPPETMALDVGGILMTFGGRSRGARGENGVLDERCCSCFDISYIPMDGV
jgi:hypothetical protein